MAVAEVAKTFGGINGSEPKLLASFATRKLSCDGLLDFFKQKKFLYIEFCSVIERHVVHPAKPPAAAPVTGAYNVKPMTNWRFAGVAARILLNRFRPSRIRHLTK